MGVYLILITIPDLLQNLLFSDRGVLAAQLLSYLYSISFSCIGWNLHISNIAWNVQIKNPPPPGCKGAQNAKWEFTKRTEYRHSVSNICSREKYLDNSKYINKCQNVVWPDMLLFI